MPSHHPLSGSNGGNGKATWAPHCLHLLLRRLCSQMLAPPHCLHVLLWRLCSQMLAPPHCLHWILRRLCSQMLAPPHCKHLLVMQMCSQRQCLHLLLTHMCSHFSCRESPSIRQTRHVRCHLREKMKCHWSVLNLLLRKVRSSAYPFAFNRLIMDCVPQLMIRQRIGRNNSLLIVEGERQINPILKLCRVP